MFRSCLIAAVLSLLVACGTKARWQHFKVADGAYSIDMPGPPRCDSILTDYRQVQRCAFLINRLQFTVLAWSKTLDDDAFMKQARGLVASNFTILEEREESYQELRSLGMKVSGPGPDFGVAKAVHKGGENFVVMVLALQENSVETGKQRIGKHHDWVDRFFLSFKINQ